MLEDFVDAPELREDLGHAAGHVVALDRHPLQKGDGLEEIRLVLFTGSGVLLAMRVCVRTACSRSRLLLLLRQTEEDGRRECCHAENVVRTVLDQGHLYLELFDPLNDRGRGQT